MPKRHGIAGFALAFGRLRDEPPHLGAVGLRRGIEDHHRQSRLERPGLGMEEPPETLAAGMDVLLGPQPAKGGRPRSARVVISGVARDVTADFG